MNAIALNALAGFSKGKSEPANPQDFLPFNLTDNNPFYKQIKPYTAFIFLKLQRENKIPISVLRAFLANAELYQAIVELGS